MSQYYPVFILVFIVLKNGVQCMCPNFRALNKLILRDKLPIAMIDDLMDELHGAMFFNIQDLCYV